MGVEAGVLDAQDVDVDLESYRRKMTTELAPLFSLKILLSYLLDHGFEKH